MIPADDRGRAFDSRAAQGVYRIGSDGKLEFVRKYDVDTAQGPQWWSGIVTLPA